MRFEDTEKQPVFFLQKAMHDITTTQYSSPRSKIVLNPLDTWGELSQIQKNTFVLFATPSFTARPIFRQYNNNGNYESNNNNNNNNNNNDKNNNSNNNNCNLPPKHGIWAQQQFQQQQQQ